MYILTLFAKEKFGDGKTNIVLFWRTAGLIELITAACQADGLCAEGVKYCIFNAVVVRALLQTQSVIDF